jgi:ribonuclease HI
VFLTPPQSPNRLETESYGTATPDTGFGDILTIPISQRNNLLKQLFFITQYIICATDGSLEKQSNTFLATGAAAVYTLQDTILNTARTLPSTLHVSILTCETLALYLAVCTAVRNGFPYIHVLSDSKGVVDRTIKLQNNKWIINDITTLTKNNIERQIWIKIAKHAMVLRGLRISHVRSHAMTKTNQSTAKLLNDKADNNAKNQMIEAKQKYRRLSGLPLWRISSR